MPSQEGIELLFFEAIRRPRTFLVPGTHVARDRPAKRFSFGALESDDFLRHRLLLGVVGLNFLFLGFSTFFIG